MRNPVAKFQHRYNKSKVFTDRKREMKKTGRYHTGRHCLDDDFYDDLNGFAGEYDERTIK